MTLGLSQIIENVLLNVTNEKAKIGQLTTSSSIFGRQPRLVWQRQVSVGHWGYVADKVSDWLYKLNKPRRNICVQSFDKNTCLRDEQRGSEEEGSFIMFTL